MKIAPITRQTPRGERGRRPLAEVDTVEPGRNARRGSVVLEFALTFPLLVLVVAGVFQFGHTFFVYNNLQSAVRSGARFASLADYDGPNGTEFNQLVKNLALYGTTAPNQTSKPVAPGLTTANINVNTVKDGKGFPIRVSVSITGYTVQAVWNKFALNNKPRSTFTYMGQFR